jgi:hypothetical protein
MMARGMNLKVALDHVRERRTIAEPNPGFMIQLKAFEKVIFGILSDCPIMISKKLIKMGDTKGAEVATELLHQQTSEEKEIADAVDQLEIVGE